MSYRDRLHFWLIISVLANAQTITVARFRRRGEAEAHLQVLKRMNPNGLYEIVFSTDDR